MTDCKLSQNRHCLASNGALDWEKGYREKLFRHTPGIRPCHWEFVHNLVDGDDETMRHGAVDTHTGMDGTFVVEANIFQNIATGIGIVDGSGIIRGNIFRDLWGQGGRKSMGMRFFYDTHNGVAVENSMPHDIEVTENIFPGVDQKYDVGKGEFKMPPDAEKSGQNKIQSQYDGHLDQAVEQDQHVAQGCRLDQLTQPDQPWFEHLKKFMD
ncbi:MAG: hypothetical protein KKG09_10945 [Verrucomicrobia bacterium]|nr:hypothetical protein [Verrucomicrobiota bacterium]MCG2678671.1 hypothetical protein [Kiritimatiellia bacterium]MBU4248493.1 hypothetical protein [Verrucomicrobiota bacterium]MBU4291305.1 hypothetical protein [Verrucomicrobiota bacterium]MBU4429187.1 hypothetical protein [Verrucomicrobiota bacterium]